jgi:hypothetical protein
MTTEYHKLSQEPTSNTAFRMQSKHMRSVWNLLRDTMGMSDSAASIPAMRAQRSKRPASYMRNFLHAAIEDQVDAYRMQSFAKFGLDIAVFCTPNAMRMKLDVEHFGRVTIGYHNYTFQPYHNEGSPKTMRVRLHQGGVQVYFCSSWQPVSAYLDQVSTKWTYPAPPHLEINRQYYWWRSNGKSFEITKLPGEIRNAIFDIAFPSEARPFETTRCRKRGRLVPKYQHSCMALMRVNRQLYQEASDWFYRATTFSIDRPQLFSMTLDNRFLRDRLRHVRFTLTHSGYMDLFSSRGEGSPTRPYVKHQLREMSNLTRLEIHISPSNPAAENIWLEGACQKKAVDMIIDAAWPSIRGLPVTITGFVKDSQKKAIEARIHCERETYALFEAWCCDVGKTCSLCAYDAWVDGMKGEKQGGVRLDGEAHAADESERPEWRYMSTRDLKMAMECTCKKSCTSEDWDAAD